MELKSSSGGKAFETLKLRLKELDGIEEKVGWFSKSKYEDGTPVALAAAANEVGHGKTPPRPFMRPTIAKEQASWSDTAAQLARRVLGGKMTGIQAMDGLGQIAAGNILVTIDNVFSPPLSPVTIELRAMKKRNPDLRVTGATVGEAAKKVSAPGYQAPSGVSTKPLNDSGKMRDELSHTTEKV